MPAKPKRGGAVIEPRSYTSNPKKFAHTGSRLQDGPIDTPQHAAAELQHLLCNRIREHLLDTDTTLKAYCDAVELPEGLSYERLYRMSNGTTMMSLTDLMYWLTVIPDFAATLGTSLDTLAQAMPARDGRA